MRRLLRLLRPDSYGLRTFLRIKIDMGVPTAQLVWSDAGDEEEEQIHVTMSRPSKEKAAKPDSKGKSLAYSREKVKKTRCLRLMKPQGKKENSYLMLRPPTSNSYAYLGILEYEIL